MLLHKNKKPYSFLYKHIYLFLSERIALCKSAWGYSIVHPKNVAAGCLFIEMPMVVGTDAALMWAQTGENYTAQVRVSEIRKVHCPCFIHCMYPLKFLVKKMKNVVRVSIPVKAQNNTNFLLLECFTVTNHVFQNQAHCAAEKHPHWSKFGNIANNVTTVNP